MQPSAAVGIHNIAQFHNVRVAIESCIVDDSVQYEEVFVHDRVLPSSGGCLLLVIGFAVFWAHLVPPNSDPSHRAARASTGALRWLFAAGIPANQFHVVQAARSALTESL